MGVPVIDLAGFLEDRPSARLRAPMLEPHDFRIAPDAIQVIAHPAAIAIALVLSRIHQVFPIRRSFVHVFEPASERGSAGIEELQAQTVSLLSFKPLPKKIYDTQASYAMLAAFGEEAPIALAEIEARIERHLATLLSISGGAVIPSLRLVQCPVFHGYSFSFWLEFDTNPGVAAIQQVLNEPPVDVHGSGLEPPNNVGVAGQTGVAVGSVTLDRNHPHALWLWGAADNLRLAAEKRHHGSERGDVKFVCFAFSLALTGCGYHVANTASALPNTIHTIAIPPVRNITTQYKISDLLNTYISREFISRTRYKVTPDPSHADATLTLAVVNFVSFPTIFDPIAQRATGVQAVLTIQITLRDKAGVVLFTRPNYEFRARYEISVDPQKYFDESEPAMQRLSTDAARSIVSAVLEKF